jgi:long-chain acyl-CoA synthetase
VLELATIRVGVLTVVDGRIDTLVQSLGETSPTVMAAVAADLREGLQQVRRHGEGRPAAPIQGLPVGDLGRSPGLGAAAEGRRSRPDARLPACARRSASSFSKLKARFGGRMRFFVSGGAPLSRDMAEFFHAADVLVLEGTGSPSRARRAS